MSESLVNRTRENWTWGMLNIPLLYGHNNKLGVTPHTMVRKINHQARCYNPPYVALDRTKRYPLFEIDNKDDVGAVLYHYYCLGIDVYYHETYNGYHFYAVRLMSKDTWDRFIDLLTTRYNPQFVKYALRIVPNKWLYETRIWKNGFIINHGSGDIKLLQYIKRAIESPYVFDYNATPNKCVLALENMFALSRYPFKRRLQK